MMNTLISPAEFADRRRDLQLERPAYQAQAESLIYRIPLAAERLGNPDWLKGRDPAALMRLTHARAHAALDLLTLSYSAGIDVLTLRDWYPVVLSHFEEYAAYSQAFNETPEGKRNPGPHLAIGDIDFHRANRLLCFAILLGWQRYVPRVMAIVDYNNPKCDGMLERIAATVLERSKPFPNDCRRHLPYFKTIAVFDAPASQQAELMREYLETWYDASRREPYYGTHAEGVRFLGYWAWEAAAISVTLGIDDRLYRCHQFYPRDMVDLANRMSDQVPSRRQV